MFVFSLCKYYFFAIQTFSYVLHFFAYKYNACSSVQFRSPYLIKKNVKQSIKSADVIWTGQKFVSLKLKMRKKSLTYCLHSTTVNVASRGKKDEFPTLIILALKNSRKIFPGPDLAGGRPGAPGGRPGLSGVIGISERDWLSNYRVLKIEEFGGRPPVGRRPRARCPPPLLNPALNLPVHNFYPKCKIWRLHNPHLKTNWEDRIKIL